MILRAQRKLGGSKGRIPWEQERAHGEEKMRGEVIRGLREGGATFIPCFHLLPPIAGFLLSCR